MKRDKQTKTEVRLFLVTQWEKEQEYLQRRHREGWKFERISGLAVYHFTRCEPEDVVYQLDYHAEGGKEDYVQLFRDCGWEYLQDFMGYSYFRKPRAAMRGDEGIFCDSASRLEMLQRVFRGRMVPLLVVFFLAVLPNLWESVRSGGEDRAVLSFLFLILFFVYLCIFLSYGWKVWQLWREESR